MKKTKDQQWKNVVVGIALGVIANDVKAVTSNKLSLDSAFNRAWSQWSCARHFPSIRSPEAGEKFWGVMGKSEGRRGVCAAWERHRWCTPYVIDEYWTIDDALEEHANDDISVQDWIELGRLFIEYFDPEEVIRG